MLCLNVAFQYPFTGERAGGWAILPGATESTVGVTYMRALLLASW
jgi:hypothetical protein